MAKSEAKGLAQTSNQIRLVVAVVLVALPLIFVAQNTDKGRVDFLFWHVTAPRWLWFIGLFAAGLAVGWLTGRFGDDD